MIMGQAFGIVMTGIGIIALAGVVTNNNIVLIDTYDRLRREGVPVEEAILKTCRERARPVLLTAVTAILGVLPIAFGLNIDFLLPRGHLWRARRRSGGSSFRPRSSSASRFATVLTLIVTPALLSLVARLSGFRQRVFGRRKAAKAASHPGHPVPAE